MIANAIHWQAHGRSGIVIEVPCDVEETDWHNSTPISIEQAADLWQALQVRRGDGVVDSTTLLNGARYAVYENGDYTIWSAPWDVRPDVRTQDADFASRILAEYSAVPPRKPGGPSADLAAAYARGKAEFVGIMAEIGRRYAAQQQQRFEAYAEYDW